MKHLIAGLLTCLLASPVLAESTTFVIIGDVQDCTNCPEMVAFDEGHYRMGWKKSRDDAKSPDLRTAPSWSRMTPEVWVDIVTPITVSKKMVTRAQYDEFIQATGHQSASNCDTAYALSYDYSGTADKQDYLDWLQTAHGITPIDRYSGDYNNNDMQAALPAQPDHPVVCVSRLDVAAYLVWFNATWKPAGFPDYRLMEPIEYEYVARAGVYRRYAWGGNDWTVACSHANVGDQSKAFIFQGTFDKTIECNDGYIFTSPVGAFPPNPAGLYDLDGNASDMLGGYYNHGNDPAPEHRNLQGLSRCDREPQCNVNRTPASGGAWYRGEMNLLISHRSRNLLVGPDSEPAAKFPYVGFRLTRDCRPTGPC